MSINHKLAFYSYTIVRMLVNYKFYFACELYNVYQSSKLQCVTLPKKYITAKEGRQVRVEKERDL
jgi:hypothetical protein